MNKAGVMNPVKLLHGLVHIPTCRTLMLIVCILGVKIPVKDCHTIEDTNRLLEDKLAGYNKNTRPTYNQSAATTVTFDFALIYIQEFNEIQQKLSILAVPTLSWIDESMIWNPADYGGMYSLGTESGSFWVPNLVLTSSVGKWKRIKDEWQTIRFYADGMASYSPGKLYSSVCNVDVTFYPWDIQICSLYFTPHGYGPNEIYITLKANKVTTAYYLENGGWALTDSKMQVNYSTHYTELVIELIFERKPLYIIVNVILPIIFMAFLSNVVFLIPPESGERISYSITVLLAIAVYLTIVGDNLPKLSTPMSYFSYYLLSLLVISTCIAMTTIFNLRFYHRKESDSVRGFWAKIFTCLTCRKKKYKKDESMRVNANENNFDGKILTVINGNDNIRDSNIPKIVVPPWRRKNYSDEICNSKKLTSWRDVSTALDKIFFLTYFVVLTSVTLIYFVIIVSCERDRISE